MKSLRRILGYLKPYLKEFMLGMVFIIGVVITDLMPPRLTQIIIDQGVAQRDMGIIWRTSLLMIGAALLGAVFSVLNTIYSVRTAQNFGHDIRSALVRKAQTFSFANLDHIETGQLIVRTTSDVNQVQGIVLMSMRMLMRAPLWVIGSVAMLIITIPQMVWLMLVLTPLLFVIMALFATKARPMFMAIQKKLDRLNRVLQENLAGARVVKAFVRREHEIARFGEANDDLTEHTVYMGTFMAVLIPSVFFVINLATVGAVWFGGNYVLNDTITVGQLMASFNYLTRALFPLLMLAGMIGPLSAADASAERILEVLDSEPSVPDTAADTVLPERMNGDGARLAFENVSFAYEGEHREEVLHDVSFVAEPGQHVAILGATGSGKSSLIHLVPRFYDVTEGRITLDGVDIRELPLHDLRQRVGMALQEAVLFTGSVRDNIRYGKPKASDDAVEAASKMAQAHGFVSASPEGYDTWVSQRGANFSGGQKQRLSIARALLVNPQVLILDDSTSAVDVETEIAIEQALEQEMPGCTKLVIAQRISTVLNADKILVLEGGTIAAEGTHAELLASSPIYREIYDSQLGNGGNNHGK